MPPHWDTIFCTGYQLRMQQGKGQPHGEISFPPLPKITNQAEVGAESKVEIFFFKGPHLQHMEFPGQGVKLELQLPAYATATAIPDPSCICDLHDSYGNAKSLTH